MRSSLSLLCTLAISACTGTEGDVLRTTRGSPLPVDAAAARPTPSPLSSWQIQLTGALETAEEARVYTADVDTPPSLFGALHDRGRIVLCYFSAGTREAFRGDRDRFPDATLGTPLADYPDERWLDIRDATVRSIMSDRVTRAAEVGCDGIHPSGLSAFLASSGFDIQRSDQVAYARWLANVSHDAGLSIGLVDGDASLGQELLADFDWTVVWSCLDTNCANASPFVAAGKAAFLIEFGDETKVSSVCPKAKSLGLSAILKKNTDLDAFRIGCL